LLQYARTAQAAGRFHVLSPAWPDQACRLPASPISHAPRCCRNSRPGHPAGRHFLAVIGADKAIVATLLQPHVTGIAALASLDYAAKANDVIHLVARHMAVGCDHAADDFMPWHQGINSIAPSIVVHDVQVGVADAAILHLDLSSCGLGRDAGNRAGAVHRRHWRHHRYWIKAASCAFLKKSGWCQSTLWPAKREYRI